MELVRDGLGVAVEMPEGETALQMQRSVPGVESQQTVEVKGGGEPVLGLEGLRQLLAVPAGIGGRHRRQPGNAGSVGGVRNLTSHGIDAEAITVGTSQERSIRATWLLFTEFELFVRQPFPRGCVPDDGLTENILRRDALTVRGEAQPVDPPSVSLEGEGFLA